ncbi:MAG: hypothetical protein IKA99_02255 [Clostridia bacterium]|nr:hypothetical protein [Clostridia bacterium]
MDSYSLKMTALYKALKEKNLTIRNISDALQIRISKLKKKLRNKEKFTKPQIRLLTYLLGAKTMYEVIYFPDKKFREQVYRKVFLRGKDQL